MSWKMQGKQFLKYFHSMHITYNNEYIHSFKLSQTKVSQNDPNSAQKNMTTTNKMKTPGY
jgi:hypothetical protein